MAVVWTGWMRYMFGGLWNPDKGPQRAGPGGYANDALQTVTDSRAMQMSAVFRSVRLIAETCSSLPLRSYRRAPNGDRKPLNDSHWLNGLIHEPNEVMTGSEYRESQFAQAAGWGNAYSQIVPNDADPAEAHAVELWPYKVERMEPIRNDDNTLSYKYPVVMGVPKMLPDGRVLHMRLFTVDGYMGLSPLGLARESLGVAVGADRYAASFYANGGRPSGVMTSDRLLSDKQREQIRGEFGGLAEGGQDGKRFWVLEAALKYQPITVNPEDMQMLQTRNFSVAEIARFFGVPLFLLMSSEKSTSWGSGMEQINMAFLTYTLRPYLHRMEALWNHRLIPEAERGKVFVHHDVDELLRADSTARSSYYATMVQNGLMKRNEVRQREQLPQDPTPQANELTCQVNMTTLAKLGETPPQPGADDQPEALDPSKTPTVPTGPGVKKHHFTDQELEDLLEETREDATA